jgi:hypothetical protein
MDVPAAAFVGAATAVSARSGPSEVTVNVAVATLFASAGGSSKA